MKGKNKFELKLYNSINKFEIICKWIFMALFIGFIYLTPILYIYNNGFRSDFGACCAIWITVLLIATVIALYTMLYEYLRGKYGPYQGSKVMDMLKTYKEKQLILMDYATALMKDYFGEEFSYISDIYFSQVQDDLTIYITKKNGQNDHVRYTYEQFRNEIGRLIIEKKF